MVPWGGALGGDGVPKTFFKDLINPYSSVTINSLVLAAPNWRISAFEKGLYEI